MSSRLIRRLASLTALVFAIPASTLAEDPDSWSRFHGADGRGDAGNATIPTTWSDADYSWRRKLGSRDVGSPIAIDGKVYYLVSKPGQQRIALESLDLETGQLRWSKEFEQSEHHLHQRNTFASSTPAADSQNVFIAFADPQHTWLKCLDHDGNEIWSRDFGTWQSQHGFGTSPRIFGSTVLLMNSQQAEELKPGQTPGQSRLIAVDRGSGNTLWESPLTTTRACYGVPAVFQSGDTPQIINANTGDGLFGLDPKTGRMLWNLKVFDMRVCSTPLVSGDIAIGTAGSGGGGNHLVAVRIPTAPGQQPTQLYRIDRGAPYVPTSVLRDKRLYMISDEGIASCADVETGEVIWTKRIGGNFGASPILIGNVLLMISLDGKATLLQAGEEYQLLGEVDLNGWVGATPAFSQGRLLLRVDDELRCLAGQPI
jgi:outer membrane protein assembly factor BamB